MKTSDLILHSCCAPCAGGCVAFLLANERVPLLFFSNSNLCSKEEFDKRLASVKKLAGIYGLELLVDPYDHTAWLDAVKGLENEPEKGERCKKCFAFSLARTAEIAHRYGRGFATTLTVSPHKNSAVIFEAAGEDELFEKIDFKKGGNYQVSCRIAAENEFYRQKFCGCEFSLDPGKKR